MGLYFAIREKVRFLPIVNASLYLGQSLRYSFRGRLVPEIRRFRGSDAGQGVALCLRFRDEARYLGEWLEYHRVAGVNHFFLYNNFSSDDFQSVVQPWIETGQATLVDWPKVPASPEAEEDCIRRALGRFAWVGFLDADEFLVIEDGRSIGAFLDGFRRWPGVGLHWRYFGSSGYELRPAGPVICAYQQRAAKVDWHIKSFVQPGRAAQCRNSHAWFYMPLGTAVDEQGRRLYGSIDIRRSARIAWINHYYMKSAEDYREKAVRPSTLDRIGMQFPTRRLEKLAEDMRRDNDVRDTSAVDYYRGRCRALGCAPVLLESSTLTH